MTTFTNPLYPTQSPANTSFASVAFTTLAVLLWDTENLTDTNEYYVALQTNMVPTNVSTVMLPKISLASTGASFILTNLSAYTITVQASDASSVTNITTGQSMKFILKSNSVTGSEATAWQFEVLGATTNTNTLAQNLGNSLKFIGSTNNVQVGQMVTAIQVALPLTGTTYNIDSATAITYCATTLYNPPEITTQTNILLASANTLYAACGFYCTFVNEASYPVVLQTTGDTINGVPLQTTTDSASFVIAPGSSVTLTSSNNQDWVIMNQSTQFQSVFKTATLNWSTATYIYLSTASSINYTQSSIVASSANAAAVAIDMSNNLDFIYSPLWILTGTVPTDIATLMATLGQTIVWILLPNNLSYIYFLQARVSGTLYKVGLGARFGNTLGVALPPSVNASPATTTATWAYQYSAQINPTVVDLDAQFVSALLVAGSGGGGGGTSFPDISDVDGLVTILGIPGLYIPNGPTRMISPSFIGPNQIAVVIPSSTIGDIVIAGTAGATRDSGKTFSTSVTMGGASASNNLIPTQLAVRTFVDNAVSGIFDLKGSWNATTNTPTLVQAVGVTGEAYMCTVGGTQTILDAAEFPPSGTYTFSPGDLVFFGATQWHVLESANFVISVNGQTGVVTLTLADIDGVTISGPVTGEGLIYNSGTSKWENNFPTIPGITANGTTVVINSGIPFSVLDAAAFSSTALFDDAVTFNTTPPTYTGTYAPTPPDTDLATIGYVRSNILAYPDLSDTIGVSINVLHGVLLACSGAATVATTLGVTGLSTLTGGATIGATTTVANLIVNTTANINTELFINQAYGARALSINATTNGVGLRAYAGNGVDSAPVMRGYDGGGEAQGLAFRGVANGGKVLAEWNGSILATLADLPGGGPVGFNDFNSSTGSNGYFECPANSAGIQFCIQWCEVSLTSNVATVVNLPITFSNVLLNSWGSVQANDNIPISVGVVAVNNGSVRASLQYGGSITRPVTIWAIGFNNA